MQFARRLGLCFQIRDDIFDYFDDAAEIGKPTGNDLREGKITLPLLYTLTADNMPGRQEMLAIASKENLSDSDIAQLVCYARDNGGIDYAYNRMRQLRDEAMDILLTFPPSEMRDAFATMIDYVIARAN